MEHGDALRARRDAALIVERKRKRLSMPAHNGMLTTLTGSAMIAIGSVVISVIRTKVTRISRIPHGHWRLAALTYYAANAHMDVNKKDCGLATIKDVASRSQKKLSVKLLLNMGIIHKQKPNNAMNASTGRRLNEKKFPAEV